MGIHLGEFYGKPDYADVYLRFSLSGGAAVAASAAAVPSQPPGRCVDVSGPAAAGRSSRSGSPVRKRARHDDPAESQQDAQGGGEEGEGGAGAVADEGIGMAWMAVPLLPAHGLIIAMSPRLRAQMERWRAMGSAGASEVGPKGEPVLRIPLDSEAEVYDALEVRAAGRGVGGTGGGGRQDWACMASSGSSAFQPATAAAEDY